MVDDWKSAAPYLCLALKATVRSILRTAKRRFSATDSCRQEYVKGEPTCFLSIVSSSDDPLRVAEAGVGTFASRQLPLCIKSCRSVDQGA